MAEAGRDDVNRDAGQEQRRRVDVAEIVEPGERERLRRVRLVLPGGQGRHEGRHGVRVDRRSPATKAAEPAMVICFPSRSMSHHLRLSSSPRRAPV